MSKNIKIQCEIDPHNSLTIYRGADSDLSFITERYNQLDNEEKALKTYCIHVSTMRCRMGGGKYDRQTALNATL